MTDDHEKLSDVPTEMTDTTDGGDDAGVPADAIRLGCGDKVTYVREEGEEYNALVLHPMPGEPHIIVMVGSYREEGERGRKFTDIDSGVYGVMYVHDVHPHTELRTLSEFSRDEKAFKLGWAVSE